MQTDGERIYHYLLGKENEAEETAAIPLMQGGQRWENEKYKLKHLIQGLADAGKKKGNE